MSGLSWCIDSSSPGSGQDGQGWSGKPWAWHRILGEQSHTGVSKRRGSGQRGGGLARGGGNEPASNFEKEEVAKGVSTSEASAGLWRPLKEVCHCPRRQDWGREMRGWCGAKTPAWGMLVGRRQRQSLPELRGTGSSAAEHPTSLTVPLLWA